MSTPIISVIVPVYGVELYIEACLRSIAAQTFTDYELILVDDGSLDHSVEIAEGYLKTTCLDWRIVHQENQGQGVARDHGIQLATGEYVLCVDSDDTLAPNLLESLYNAAKRYNCEACFPGFQFVSELDRLPSLDSEPEYRVVARNEMQEAFLLRKMRTLLPGMLIRRETIRENDILSLPQCRFSEEVYFIWLVFSCVQKIAYTNAPLYYYLLRNGSTMSAPSVDKVLSGYDAFCQLIRDERLNRDFRGVRYLLPRWVLGALHAVARYMDRREFLTLCETMSAREHAKELKGFPEYRARMLAALLAVSPGLFHSVIHTLGR